MAKRKAKKPPPNPTAADMPQNPEFQAFFANLGQVLSVPKTQIDAMIAAERAAKAQQECESEPPLEC